MTGALVLPSGTALVPALDPVTKRFPDVYAPLSVAANAAAAQAAATAAQLYADAARQASLQAGGSTAAAQAASAAQAAAASAAQSATDAQAALLAIQAAGGGGTFTGTLDASKVTGLSTVATTGNYGDLSNPPTIPATAADVQAVPATPFNAAGGWVQLDLNGQVPYQVATTGTVYLVDCVTKPQPPRPTSRQDLHFWYRSVNPIDRSAGMATDADDWIRATP